MQPPPSPAAQAFTLAAATYDDIAVANPIMRRLRARAQSRMLRHWRVGDSILELNCGTGADALFLARHGIRVFATDAAEGMIRQTRAHISDEQLEQLVHAEVLSFEELPRLSGNRFDGALSMFGGLNCATDLPRVAQDLAELLRDDGVVVASFIGKYSAWEMLSAFARGNVGKMFRRWSKRVIEVRVEGLPVPTRYWSVPELCAAFRPYFEVTRIESWSALSPLPSSTRMYRRYPRLCEWMFHLEERCSHRWPVNRLGDHVMVELKKK